MKLMFSYWDNNNIYVWRSSLLLFVSLLEWIFFTRFTLYHANDRWRSIAVLYIHARQMLIRIWTDKMVFAANVRIDPTTTLHVANSTWKKKKTIQTYSFIRSTVKMQNNCSILCAFSIHIPSVCHFYLGLVLSLSWLQKCNVPRATCVYIVCSRTRYIISSLMAIFFHLPISAILYTFAICSTFSLLIIIMHVWDHSTREVSAICWQRDGMAACLSSSQTLVNVKYVLK